MKEQLTISEYAQAFCDQYGGNPQKFTYRIRQYVQSGKMPTTKGAGNTSPHLIDQKYVEAPPATCDSLIDYIKLSNLLTAVATIRYCPELTTDADREALNKAYDVYVGQQ